MIKLKLLIGGIVFIPLVAVLCDFGFGRFWFSERLDSQTLGKKTEQLSANAVSNQHGSASNKASVAQVNSHIFTVPNEFQGKIIQQAQLSKPDKVIALTFDDGPAPKYTQQVLQILKEQNITACCCTALAFMRARNNCYTLIGMTAEIGKMLPTIK
ncbi:hypothetical protein ANSO36C_65730 (plasmid) [Nostoc cf. commune SO-36]|uniref:NodB homology domain-containing protein n=1 Tax=Nostoc cf. commune SO-36 TaxID=449208 RepID=A0ABN6QEX1_NOSCO|nr:polysaccharide deacetylase family protein [Nostoc commune]BDI20771.1 hypothetical protein ANSO36C_65730 [Nostoc cf. commune SO-36]